MHWVSITKIRKHIYLNIHYLIMKSYDNNVHTNCATYVRKHMYENGFGYAEELQNVQNPNLKKYFSKQNTYVSVIHFIATNSQLRAS